MSSSAEKAMTSVTITLSDEQSQRVQRIADELAISPEECLEDLLTRPSPEFVQAANYIMENMLNYPFFITFGKTKFTMLMVQGFWALTSSVSLEIDLINVSFG